MSICQISYKYISLSGNFPVEEVYENIASSTELGRIDKRKIDIFRDKDRETHRCSDSDITSSNQATTIKYIQVELFLHFLPPVKILTATHNCYLI